MIAQVCSSINNHFTRTIEQGKFEIAGGALSPVLSKYLAGQYVRLVGPVLASGVYRVVSLQDGQMTLDGLPDGVQEDFSGIVYGLAIPPDFIDLCEQIKVYADIAKKDPEKAITIAESYGGYHYNLATNKEGVAPRWQDVYRQDLNVHRRMQDDPESEIRKNNK